MGHAEKEVGLFRVNELRVNTLRDAEDGASAILLNQNLQLGNSSGTTGIKIGTNASQKMGFFNATPIAQAILSTSASNADIVTALQNLGLVRES